MYLLRFIKIKYFNKTNFNAYKKQSIHSKNINCKVKILPAVLYFNIKINFFERFSKQNNIEKMTDQMIFPNIKCF